MKTSTKLSLKSLTLLTAALSISSFAMTTYTVKPGDSLWKIANKHTMSGIPNKDMIAAIKGVNAKENPSINDNVVNLHQKLFIPSTKAEFEDGLRLYNLKHTQYLTPTQSTPIQARATPAAQEDKLPMPNTKISTTPKLEKAQVLNTEISITPTAEKTSTTRTEMSATAKSDDNVSTTQAPTASNLSTANLASTESAGIDNNVSNTPQQPSSGIVIPTATTSEAPPTTPTTPPINVKTDLSQWYIIILITIIALIIWRRRSQRGTSFKDDKRHLKEQFYAKQSGLKTDISTATMGSSEKKNSKKKTQDELKSLLTKADELIDTHDILQAKSILQEALNSDPKNLSIRLKILTVYGADGDEISFNSERDYLASNLLPYDDNRWQEINALQNKYFGIH